MSRIDVQICPYRWVKRYVHIENERERVAFLVFGGQQTIIFIGKKDMIDSIFLYNRILCF
jgi:hypothetical protein